MPDQVHMIFTPLVETQVAKGISLESITKGNLGSIRPFHQPVAGSVGDVWQEESFDRVLQSSEKLDEKIDYILNNPVRAGLVATAEDYPWLWALDPDRGRDAVERSLGQSDMNHVGPDAAVWAAGPDLGNNRRSGVSLRRADEGVCPYLVPAGL